MKKLLVGLWCVICVVSGAQAQLFSENFTRGTDPGALTPWQTNAGGGAWTITGGVMKGGFNPAFSYGFTFVTNNWTNFSAQAQFQFPAGAFGGGIGGRLEPVGGAHYAAWLYPENNTGDSNVFKLIRFTSYSSFSVLASTNLSAVGTNSHTVKIEFTGSIINGYLDGAKILTATDANYSSGGVSLDFWSDATPYQLTADNVLVSSTPVTATADSYNAVLGIPLTVTAPGVLANDSGGNGALTASLITAAARGTLTLNSNGGFTYNATNGYTGPDSFVYRATDGTANSNATVSITVGPNHAPVANADSYAVLQNSTLTVSATGVLGNDTDSDGNSLTAVLVSGPANGTLTLTNNGGFTYTPTSGYSGSDTFTYKANDGLSDSANTTVTISVLSIVPLYSDNFTRASLAPWIAQTGNWTVTNNVLRGGTNTSLSYGVASITNLFTNFSVQASIQFPAGAFGGGLDACLNTATGARYSAWIYPEGSAGGGLTLKLIKFQTYNSFAYNGANSLAMQTASLTSVGTGLHTLKLATAGNRVAVFFDGVLKISETDIDSGGVAYTNGTIGADFWTDAAGYQMTVDDVLVAPLVNSDSYSTSQDTAVTVNAPGVLANDTEIYGSSLTAAVLTPALHGTISFNSNGGFTYTPTNGYSGSDSFTYQAIDGANSIGTATVNLTIGPGGFAENFDGVTSPALPAGWTSTVTGVQTAWTTRTTTNDTAPNSVFVPDTNNVGTAALLSPTIAVASGQSRLSFRNFYRFESGTGTIGYDGGVLEIKIGAGAFTDILDAGGSFVTNGYNRIIDTNTAYQSPLAGRPAWSGTNNGFVTTLVNLPAAAAGQNIQLRWLAGTDNANGGGGWNIDTVSITNCPTSTCWNTPPLLADLPDRTMIEVTTLTVSNAATDADLPPQTLTYSLLNAPANASINTSNGVITFSPSESQGGTTNTITTRVFDSGTPVFNATNRFVVVVLDTNNAPVLPEQFNGTNFTILEQNLLTVANTATDSDIPANTVTYTLNVTNAAGVVTNASISASGVITWTPTEAQGPSTNTFVTRATDNGSPAKSATNTFTVIVLESNSVPVLPNQIARTILPNSSVSVTNTATDTDIPVNVLTYALVSPPSFATIDTNSGVITLSPTLANLNNTYAITTIVTDSNPIATNSQQLKATNTFNVLVSSGPLLGLSASTLVLEGCLPTNSVIDSGETVTLLFSIQNTGSANTTNLVVTLLETNGVAAPSGPQSYGVVIAGGSAVSQTFTLTATGTCGSSVIPTLVLQDGSTQLGTLSSSFTLGTIKSMIMFTQNFDSVTAPALPSGWTTVGTGSMTNWRTVATTVDTAPNTAFSAATNSVGINELVSPAIAVPSGTVQLSFRHSYSLEADNATANTGYDGAVLEIKIGAGSFVDITNAGGVFVTGGYNRTISGAFSSPIANRGAWSGTNGSFTTTTVTLPPSASGQTVQFRWRVGTDNGGPVGAGWRVDTIGMIGNGYACCTNSAPNLPAQIARTVNELAPLTVTNTATDAEAPPQTLAYTLNIALSNAPANIVTNASISTNGVITWTPTEAHGPGVYLVTTVVFDNANPSLSATNSFYVTVNEVNSAPTLTLPPTQTIDELTLWTTNISAIDGDIPANTLTFALLSGPSGLTISPSGVVTWTPGELQGPSSNNVTVRVFDNGSPSLSNTNSFVVMVNEVNSAPSLGLPADQTINEQVLWTGNATAVDTDSPPNTVTFELVSGPSGLFVSPSGVITWTPTEAQGPGAYPISVRVFDNGSPSLSTTNGFTLTVSEQNSAPDLTVPASVTIDELALWSANATGIDTDSPPNTLTFELVSGPTGLTVSSAGLISWTPTEAQGPSTNTVVVRVFDDGSPVLSTTNSFTVTVREVNSAPTLMLPDSQTIDELALWTTNVSAIDTDSPPNSVTFELVSGPSGLNVSTNGVITWTPSEAQGPGTNTVTVRVFDDGSPSLSATNSFTVTVNEVNSAPSITVPTSQAIDSQILWTGNASATDSDSPTNTLTFELLSGPAGLTVSAAGLVSWTPGSGDSGTTNTVSVRVFDDGIPVLSATNSFVLTVNSQAGPVAPPTIQSITLSNDVVIISWSTISNQTYMLQRADMLDTNWADVPPAISATGTTTTTTDSVGSVSNRWYRIHLVP